MRMFIFNGRTTSLFCSDKHLEMNISDSELMNILWKQYMRKFSGYLFRNYKEQTAPCYNFEDIKDVMTSIKFKDVKGSK